MSETDFNALAELLYPDIDKTPEDYERFIERQLKEGRKGYPLCPNPTGYIHIGNLFTAMISKLAAEVSGGVFSSELRTPIRKEVENGVSAILSGLSQYGIVPMEGMTGEDSEKGAYSPSKQSLRKEIYACFAKDLVRKGLAYPCFCTEEELNEMREKQVQASVNTGYYGEWASAATSALRSKEPYRERTPLCFETSLTRQSENYIKTEDMLRGRMEMPENNMDVVLIKSDGIPHMPLPMRVDDHLMRTNLVVRSDEWIASLPAHLEIFKALGFKPPSTLTSRPL